MIKTIYDLTLFIVNEREDQSKMSCYANEFYQLVVEQNESDVILSAVVEPIKKDLEMPIIEVYYHEGWYSNIQYPSCSMSIDNYKGIGQDYVNACQWGQISSQVIVNKLNELEEAMMMRHQQEMMDKEYLEELLEDMLNPIEGEDCSHWRDKVWLPKKHYV